MAAASQIRPRDLPPQPGVGRENDLLEDERCRFENHQRFFEIPSLHFALYSTERPAESSAFGNLSPE
jgi:hypothetical protein